MSTLLDVRASVRSQTTLIAGLAALLVGLRDQIKDLELNLSEEEQAQVDEIFTEAEKNKAELVRELQENTSSPPATTGTATGLEVLPAPAPPEPAPSGTVVEAAVAEAAGAATTALGDVKDAVTAGDKDKALEAISALEGAHAELAGVNENDTKAAEEKLAKANEELKKALEEGKDPAAATEALAPVAEAHNELIEAASAAPDPAAAEKPAEDATARSKRKTEKS